MTCVARLGLGSLRDDVQSRQPGAIGRPRHDWSMRWLGVTCYHRTYDQ